jgi:Flp pilus assembly protein TadD
MGWMLVFLFAAVAALGLWWFGKMPRATLELVGAALFLGIAGYAWQSNPSLGGTPVQSVESAAGPSEDEDAIIKSYGEMSAESQWLDMASALIRAGRSRTAVSLIRSGLKKSPNNPDLWVGLGNALVVHNGGQMSPASQFAFEKAAQLSPNHPGPPFFLGLALAQSGKFAEAGEVWRALLARAPDGVEWKADLEQRLAQIGQMTQAKPSK